MDKTATTTRFSVFYTFNDGATGGRIYVDATDKAAAAIEAPRALVRFAKGYEAKHGVAYAHRGDQHDAYTVTSVRKAAVR